MKGCGSKVVVPLHPRTRNALEDAGILDDYKDMLIEPVGYLDMLMLESNAKKILTDSGGVQKEAYFLGVPCITMRDTTEWVELVECGWNILVAADKEKIISAVKTFSPSGEREEFYGKGDAPEQITHVLKNDFLKTEQKTLNQ